MSKRNLYLAGIFILFTVLAAIGFSQANKVRNIEATLWPPDYEAASALIAEGGCTACHKMPAIDGANGTLWPSLCKPQKSSRKAKRTLNSSWNLSSIRPWMAMMNTNQPLCRLTSVPLLPQPKSQQ